ncbi:hypothetical protein [Pseudomonas abieticivorans]|uniref:hypothetical protein n=1 Tax=Pseudomonas abieticivorans TaxID=2931382 RepID=UPI0020BE8A98|nr:hypothetical protein [Pseudomonas sp. PIA16]
MFKRASLLLIGLFASIAAQAAPMFNTALPVPLGVQIMPKAVTDDDLARIKAAGFDFVRFGVRPPVALLQPGVIDYDRLLARINAHGLQALVTLFGGNQVWGNTVAADPQPAEAFAQFAATFVGAHLDQVQAWELWNEPEIKTFLTPGNEAVFSNAVAAFCSQLKAANVKPKHLMGFGFARFPYSDSRYARFGSDIERAAKQGCITDISVHPYRRTPETVSQDYQVLRANLDAHGLGTIGIVSSEWGYASYFPVRTQAMQANLLLRMYLANIAAGVKAASVYAWKDSGSVAISREQNFGLMQADEVSKPALADIQAALATLKHFTLQGYVKTGSLNQLTLKDGLRQLDIFWADQGRMPVRAALRGYSSCQQFALAAGDERSSCSPDKGEFELNVDTRPLAILTVAP